MMIFTILCSFLSVLLFPPVASNGSEMAAAKTIQGTIGRASGSQEKEVKDLLLSAEARLERCRADVRRATEDLKKRELQGNRIKLQLRNKILLAERKELDAQKARKVADDARAESVAIQSESLAIAASAVHCKQILETLVSEAKTAEASLQSLKLEYQQQSFSNRVHVRVVGSSRLAAQSRIPRPQESKILVRTLNRSAPALRRKDSDGAMKNAQHRVAASDSARDIHASLKLSRGITKSNTAAAGKKTLVGFQPPYLSLAVRVSYSVGCAPCISRQ